MSYDIKKIMSELNQYPINERLAKAQQLLKALEQAKLAQQPKTLDELIDSKSPLHGIEWESGMSFNDLLPAEELHKRNSLASGDEKQLLAKLARMKD